MYIAELNDDALYLLMYYNLCLMQCQYDAQTQTISLLFALSLFCDPQIWCILISYLYFFLGKKKYFLAKVYHYTPKVYPFSWYTLSC